MSEHIHICCFHCNAVNRLPAARVDENGSCGRCKKALFSGEPFNLTAQNAAAQLGKSDLPVVIDFWADWCGPCKIFAPTFTQAAKKFRTTARFAKLNTEAESELAAQFHIRSIPTLVIMKNGRESTRQSGAMSLVQFESWLREQIG